MWGDMGSGQEPRTVEPVSVPLELGAWVPPAVAPALLPRSAAHQAYGRHRWLRHGACAAEQTKIALDRHVGPGHPILLSFAPVKRCRDGEQRRRSQPTAPENGRLDVIQTAVWFVATQSGGPARILAAHHRLPDGYCAGCLATPMRWPCTVAAIATNAISAQHDLGLIVPNRS